MLRGVKFSHELISPKSFSSSHGTKEGEREREREISGIERGGIKKILPPRIDPTCENLFFSEKCGISKIDRTDFDCRNEAR